MVNLYHILGVSEHASELEIKAAFKQGAKRYHPDRNPGSAYAEERFKQLNEAYQILSHPQKKWLYDATLRGSRIPPNHNPSARTQAPRYTYRKAQQEDSSPFGYPFNRSKGSYSKVFSKENLRHTFYAFAFSFVIALVVMTAFQAREYYFMHKEKVLLTERQDLFDMAVVSYELNNWADALELLKKVDDHYPSATYIDAFRGKLINEISDKVNLALENKNYQEAQHYLELIREFKTTIPYHFQLQLALVYGENGHYEQSLEVYQEIVDRGMAGVEVHVSMGYIFLDQLEEKKAAYEQFKTADQKALQNLEATYGKAYGVFLNPQKLAPQYYDLYLGLAESALAVGKLQDSYEAAKWMLMMDKENPAGFILKGKVYQKGGQASEACEEWKKALRLNSAEAVSLTSNFCP